VAVCGHALFPEGSINFAEIENEKHEETFTRIVRLVADA
jgi:hypothetical protein